MDWSWDPIGDAITDYAGDAKGYVVQQMANTGVLQTLGSLLGKIQAPSEMAMLNPFEYGYGLVAEYARNAYQTMIEPTVRNFYLDALYGQPTDDNGGRAYGHLYMNPLGPSSIPDPRAIPQMPSLKQPYRQGFIGPPDPYPNGYTPPTPARYVFGQPMQSSLVPTPSLMLQLPPSLGQQYQQGNLITANALWHVIDGGRPYLGGPVDELHDVSHGFDLPRLVQLFSRAMRPVPPPIDEKQQYDQANDWVAALGAQHEAEQFGPPPSSGPDWNALSAQASSDVLAAPDDTTLNAPSVSPTDPEAAYQNLPPGWVIYEDGSIGPPPAPPSVATGPSRILGY